jgi:hypothetical protein
MESSWFLLNRHRGNCHPAWEPEETKWRKVCTTLQLILLVIRCAHTHTHTHTIHTDTHTQNTHRHTRTHIDTHAHTHTRTHTRAHTHTCTHTEAHTHTQKHTHISMCKQKGALHAANVIDCTHIQYDKAWAFCDMETEAHSLANLRRRSMWRSCRCI